MIEKVSHGLCFHSCIWGLSLLFFSDDWKSESCY